LRNNEIIEYSGVHDLGSRLSCDTLIDPICCHLNIKKRCHLEFFLKAKQCFFYQLSGLLLDPSSQLNRLDHVKTTSTRVNFKLRVSKMLDREGSRLVHWIIFNNNVK
jgi:hypothetical protein